MQLRSFVATVAVLAGTYHVNAQQKPAGKTTDTGAVQYVTPKNALLAYNATATDYQGKSPYSKVPLAGEKSYFGDKNEFINAFVRTYMEHNNRTLSCVQNNCTLPFSVIDHILDAKKMPRELKYLAVIESALNNNAISPAGAVGPWQLMESTAKMMGLTVNRTVDERKDWTKSTDAATRYLDLLYTDLNDWLLVIAAYNSGPTPVLRAIEKTGSRNFWDIKQYLPQETQGHVLAFVATATIFENFGKYISLGSVPADFKFSTEKEEEPIEKEPVVKKANTPPAAPAVAGTGTTNANFTEEELKNIAILKIDKPVLFEVMEHELGISKKLMARWNPDYEQFVANKYPTPYYKIKMPKDKVDAFLMKKQALEQISKNMYK